MAVRRRVRVTVPATTANLGPGFDTLGMALDIRNVLELWLGSDGISLEIRGEGSDRLPRDESNLVVRAMELAADRCGRSLPGFKLRMENSIPLERGLGSSAAAAVGGVALAAAALDLPFTPEDILALAVQLEGHPDNVAPCLLGGLTVAVPGDRPRALRLDPPELSVVLLVPEVGLETVEARAVLPRVVPREDAIFNVSRAALWIAAVVTGQYEWLTLACADRLHQPYRKQLMPYLEGVMEAALSAGAVGAFLSGAGTSVAALACQDNVEAVARSMDMASRTQGVEGRVMVTQPAAEGLKVEVE